MHYRVANRYSECWIPDYPDTPNLAGDLSHPSKLPRHAHYVGPLTRFTEENQPVDGVKYDLVAVLSGPEPQRTIFEKLVLEQLPTTGLKSLVVCGKSESDRIERLSSLIDKADSMTSSRLEPILRNGRMLLTRPGYSTLMDLDALQIPAILVPTPGQTEQEYLAGYYSKDHCAVAVSQERFDLPGSIANLERVSVRQSVSTPRLSFIPRLERLLQSRQSA
jgi:predicted glycosyltransferase